MLVQQSVCSRFTYPMVCVQGVWLSKLMSYFGDKEARILVLGLDNAGKTTILCACLCVL